MSKLKSKSKLKTKIRREEKWTAKAWYEVEVILGNVAFNGQLTKKQRAILAHLAELAGETADRLSGYTPEIQAEYYAKCAAEDAAMVARRTPNQAAAFAAEEMARDAEYKASRKDRVYSRVSNYSGKKKKATSRPPQLELQLA